nr:MAG: hypothetical protein [Bacteriophage sp.]
MEEKTEFRISSSGGERSTKDVYVEIKQGNSERWAIQSQKSKYVNGKLSGVIGVGYSASIDNTSDYSLEESKDINQIQITALYDGTSGTCVLTQNESDNKINLHFTTPEEKEYWEIRFSPLILFGVTMDAFFAADTNIKGEYGSMTDGTLHKNWIVNQNRNTINIYISTMYPGDYDMLSWSCLDKDGKAFAPNYNIPGNQYFTTKTTGLGSYTLTKVSTPSVSNGTLILSSSFNPTKKYPLDLNFYWGVLIEDSY